MHERQKSRSTKLPPYRVKWALLAVAAMAPMTAVASRTPPPQVTTLKNTAPSMNTLIRRFLDALATKNQRALRKLRVNEREYIDVIMPGSIEPGKERRTFPEEKAQFFWSVLDEKSAYSEANLLNVFGGHHYRIADVSWRKGVKQFDGYTGYAQLRLKVEDEKGESREIDTGSVAEIGGRYKFVSFIRD